MIHSRSIDRFILAVCLLLPFATNAERYRNVGAAVATRSFGAELHFEDGSVAEHTFRRAGVEYWEGLTDHVWMGFTIGYAEDEARSAFRPFETIGGNYGSLGVRFDVPVRGPLSVRGRAEYLLQRDRRDTGSVNFETRTLETRAELGPLLRYRAFEVAVGASWRDLDYRETLREAAGDTARHADAVENTGAFAALGIRTDPEGGIGLRYDTGAEEGWSLRFERTF